MTEISFGVLHIAMLFGIFIGAMFLGRAVRAKACSFFPDEPLSVMFFTALICGAAVAWYLDMLSIMFGIVIGMAAFGYIVGYPLGDFSTRGIVELSVGKETVELNAYKIAYYYNHELKTRCIADYPGQKFRNKCRRLFKNIHETMEFPLDHVQSRTKISVDNNWYTLKVSGSMTYVIKKETRTIERNGKKITYTHHEFMPADITQLGPYDFFMRTELYLVALDIANEANALRVKADIEGKKAAAEGGATIVSAIAKLDPADAAANLKELKEFIMTDKKTTTEESKPNDKEEKKEEGKRWWQVWRRKKK
ncbi:MAG: hypothetical protein FWG19_00090 [Methanomassiliicoccaceae archaeon]|nr:hypothetical protein [Methanomassiliicoccaceae archaeon]